ncbi:hypothetical protein ABFT80_22385 [Mesorhizobium sp. SB112]|uniref:hypothetical protein n=1 Tax=Mesorhizobium sp. SB112 TaxID=3151853 RepID=UPI003264B3D0
MKNLRFTAISLIAATALSACTSTQDVLDPAAIEPPGTAAATPSANPGTSNAPANAVAKRARIQIAPIIGASAEAATPLTARLVTKARERGLTVFGSAESSTATHSLKGYFSVFSEDNETTVIYVWDIYDPAGTRLHRINGQQKMQASPTPGWPGVPASEMETIADSTVDQLVTWLSSQTG